MQFADLPQGAGAFFKPAEYADAVAILVDVKRFEAQRPGNFGPKDTVHADIFAFSSEADIEAGKASISQGALIQNGALVRDLAGLVGNATIVKLDKAFFKQVGKEGWVWKPVDAALKAKVIAYATKRQQELEAAMEDAPDF